MKGQMVAIEQASIQKKCGFNFSGHRRAENDAFVLLVDD